MHDSDIRDVTGAVSPVAETIGSGVATALRDGMVFDAAWERGSPDEPTHATDPAGAPFPFAAGPIWVLLTRR